MKNLRNTPNICVVGSANMDLISRVPRLPRLGETLRGRSFHLVYGGKGANQAVMAAQLGAQVTVVCRVGNDVFGEGMVRNFQSYGIQTANVTVDVTHSSGVAPIFVDDNANNVIVIIAGANGELSLQDVELARPAITSANAVICQLEVPMEATLAAFRMARASGVMTILNPAPAAELPADLLTLTDIFAPNETECEMLSGMPVTSLEQAESAARILLDMGVHAVVITLGERGALYVDRDQVLHAPAFVVKAVDSTGAGDAFIGGLAVFLSEGMPMQNALTRANAVAALSVTRIGAQVSFPSRDELDTFMVEPSGYE